MTEHRAWVRRAMARTALSGVLAALAVLAVARPTWVAGVLGRAEDGTIVSWVVLGAAWGALVSSMGAGLAWTRVAEAA